MGNRYNWKIKERANHVRQRLAERYGIIATNEDIADMEAALNTMGSRDFFPKNDEYYSDGCFFYYRDKLILAVTSRPSWGNNGIRRLLTVLPNNNGSQS